MSKQHYVFSKLTNDNEYTSYNKGNGDIPTPAASVLIKGCAGVANKALVTADGAVTVVDENQLKLLQANEVFKLHVANGFIVVSDKPMTVEDGLSEATAKEDPSAPLTNENPDKGKGGINPAKPTGKK